MAVIANIDGLNRRIYLSVNTENAEVHPIDIYKEMRTLRRTDESLRNFDNFLLASGNEPKGGGKFTPRLVKCLLGMRIVPYDSTHTLTITGEIITDEGTGGLDCFDKTLLSYDSIVDINYVPPQVEVIQVSSGSGLSTEERDQLMQIKNPPSQNLNDYKADVANLEKITGNKAVLSGDIVTIYESDEVTVWKRYDLANGGRVEI